jgi:hypothetical protein
MNGFISDPNVKTLFVRAKLELTPIGRLAEAFHLLPEKEGHEGKRRRDHALLSSG